MSKSPSLSLVDSIFGSGSARSTATTASTTTAASGSPSKKTKASSSSSNTAASSLFATKLDVPTTLHSYPKASSSRKKRKNKETQDDDGAVEAVPTTKPTATAKVAATTSTRPRKAARKSVTENDDIASNGADHEDPDHALDAVNDETGSGAGSAAPKDANKKENQDDRTVFVGNVPLGYTRRDLHKLFSDCGAIDSTRIRSVPIASTGVKLPTHQAGQQDVVKKVCSNLQKIDATSKQCVTGYVVFVRVDSVEKALLKNNTVVPIKASTLASESNSSTASTGAAAVRHIRVDRVGAASTSTKSKAGSATSASSTTTPQHDAARSVFVGNLPYTADEETLAQHFVKVLTQHDAPNKSKGSSNKKAKKQSNDDPLVESGSSTDEKDNQTAIVQGVRIVRDKETHLCKGFGYVLFDSTSWVAQALQTCHGTKYLGKHELRVQVCGKRTKNQQGATTVPKATARRQAALQDTKGALQRVLIKQLTAKPAQKVAGSNKKKRGTTSSLGGGASGSKKKALPQKGPSGMSKRARSQGKTEKRVKKIEKRIAKGMGKNSKSK